LGTLFLLAQAPTHTDKPMNRIRKRDKVLLPDGSTGETLEAFITERSAAYKIRRLDNDEIQYFEASKVSLKAKDPRNFFADLFAR
jgi:hypothetical protein